MSEPQWQCVQCTFLNHYALQKCEICFCERASFNNIQSLQDGKEAKSNDQYIVDEKQQILEQNVLYNPDGADDEKNKTELIPSRIEDNKIDDDELEYECEALVHDNDLRQPIYDVNEKDYDIVKCIGQIRTVFLYNKRGPFVKKESGTGTVISVHDTTACVLTCAHVVRTFVIECPKCHKYMNIKDQNDNLILQCIYNPCNQQVSKDINLKMIEASTIEFKRRSIEYGNTFGKMLKSYECKEKVLNSTKYREYNKPPEGYDIAIISFNDVDNFYRKYCANIVTKEFTTFNKFYIFGYGKPDVNKLYGMASIGKNWEIKRNQKTQKYYLKQQVIDTLPGVSGAAMWNQQHDKTIIFGVHCGGHQASRFNIGTLIKEDYYCGFSWKDKYLMNAIVLKNKGNIEFGNGNYKKAIKLYTVAIDLESTNHKLYSNRSAA
eukprot:220378_1